MMKEEKTKKRRWIKRVAIMILVIMLFLTFFSNTIMNYSLAKVSVQNIKNGEIITSIRGSGTAEAISNYEVMINQTREVKEIFVEAGDTVNVGDKLFLLEDKESKELESALDTLDDMNFQYQKMLLTLTKGDYAKENRDIGKLNKSLEEAISKRDKINVSKEKLDEEEISLNTIKQLVDNLKDEVAKIEDERNEYSGVTEQSVRSLSRQIQDKEYQIINSRRDRVKNPVSLDSLELEYRRLTEDYDLLIAKYPDYKEVDAELEDNKSLLKNAQSELADAEKNNSAEDVINPLKENVQNLQAKVNELKNQLIDYSELTSLLRRMEDKKEEIDNYESYTDGPKVDKTQLVIELERLEEDYDNMIEKRNKYNRANSKLEKAKENLSEANETLEKKQKQYDEITKEYDDWKMLDEQIPKYQEQLEDLLFSLEQSKQRDEKTSSIENLDLQKQRQDIEKQKEVINELQADDTKIVADQSGIIKSINISAGGTASPNMTLAVIESKEKGYSLSYSITKEQSKKVAIGDKAKVDDNTVSATLKQIKNDSQSNNEKKILTFLLEGEVESGDVFSLEIQKESQEYDLIIPRSALHSDSSGDFVLTVTSKRTPFGSRFFTKRVSVKVLAEDDQNIAVDANINEHDYVITTSTKLIKPGIQVRMGNE